MKLTMNCKNCGSPDYTDYGDEVVCDYCKSSHFRSDNNMFTEHERSILIANGFRKSSHSTYTQLSKTYSFYIKREDGCIEDVTGYKFSCGYTRTSIPFEKSIKTLCKDLKDCINSYHDFKSSLVKKKGKNGSYFLITKPQK